MIKESFGSRLFDVINVSLLLVVSFSMFYPLLYCFVLSVSPEAYASQGGLFLYPKAFDFTAYQAVFTEPNLMSGLLNSLFRVLICVPISDFFLLRCVRIRCRVRICHSAGQHFYLFCLQCCSVVVWFRSIYSTTALDY